jgi:hypothetical protein
MPFIAFAFRAFWYRPTHLEEGQVCNTRFTIIDDLNMVLVSRREALALPSMLQPITSGALSAKSDSLVWGSQYGAVAYATTSSRRRRRVLPDVFASGSGISYFRSRCSLRKSEGVAPVHRRNARVKLEASV